MAEKRTEKEEDGGWNERGGRTGSLGVGERWGKS